VIELSSINKGGYIFIKPGFEPGLEPGLELGLEPGLDSGFELEMTFR
jgi:hypothetical protein